MVDLGASHSFNQIVLQWESAYGKSYSIQTSTNGASWTTIYQTTTGVGGREVLNVSGTGRYVRVYGTERGTGYGYSLYDFQVNNIAAASSSSKSSISVASSSVVSSSVVSSSVVSSAAGTVNLALNRPVVASSDEWGGNSAPQAVDGNTGTRWASQFIDNQWIYVDLGSSKTLSRVFLKWEGAYAKAYNIQVSSNTTNWTTIKSEANSDGGVDDHAVSGTGRYVRILGITRANGYGISLWDFEVY